MMRRREFIAGLGSAAAWPTAARAQQRTLPLVGYLSATDSNTQINLSAFRRGLAEIGYVEGRNAEILLRWAEYQYDRLPSLAAELVNQKVSVIVAIGGAVSALAAKAATTTIPIVFELGSDPVDLGLVASLSRPGGNITGTTFLGAALIAKRLEVLHEAIPAATSIAYLANPNTADDGRLKDAEAAARVLGVRLSVLKAAGPSDIDAAFATIARQRIGALLGDADPLFNTQREQLATLAARDGVPAIYHDRSIVTAGGLMSYGANISDAYRLAGIYTGRILNGEKPRDLPVQQSTKVELILNMMAAKALGLTFPVTLLGRADEVIE
jgi:putative tryptophan/tyrosine transport system substrate-binding protein